MNAYTSLERVQARVEASLDADTERAAKMAQLNAMIRRSALHGPRTCGHGADQFHSAPFVGNPL